MKGSWKDLEEVRKADGFFRRGDYQQSIEHAKQELSNANAVGDREGEGAACDILAKSYYWVRDYAKSIEYSKQLLRIAKGVGNRTTEGTAYGMLARSYHRAGDYKQSIECGKQQLGIAKEVGNREEVGVAYGVLAWSHYGVGEYEQGIEHGEQQLIIATEVGNRKEEEVAHEILAWSHYGVKNYIKSIEHGKQMLNIAKEAGNREGVRVAYYILGRSYHRSGQHRQANECFKRETKLQERASRKRSSSAGDFKEAAAAGGFPNDNSVPSEIKARGPRAKLAYENALKTGKVKVYRARLMLIGQDRAGKTSLKKSFLSLPFDPDEQSTDGIDVDPSKFEVDVDHVRNWQRTDEKSNVPQSMHDLARMVAGELQKEEPKTDAEVQYEPKEIRSRKNRVMSWLGGKFRKKSKREKNTEGGMDPNTQPNANDTHAVQISEGNNEAIQEAKVGHQMVNHSENATGESAIPELKIDPTLPPKEFTHLLIKHLKGLHLQTDATEMEHHIILDLWDFAGQHLYYASYPVFLSPRAVYMLVYNLNKGLQNIAQPRVRQGIHDTPLSNPTGETNLENFLSWLVSVSSLCASNPEKDKNNATENGLPYLHPPVFIVGTHADKPHQDIKEMEMQIKKEISGKDYEGHVIRPFFSVDNTQGSSDEGVAALQKRLIEVLKQEPYMGEEVPLRWFNFEKVVEALVAKETYYLTLEQLQAVIQKVCFIESASEAETMLDFYHDLGMIVKHRNTVVLQAQWLIDVFKQLITIRSFSDMEPKHSKLWKEMETTGALSMALVDHVFSKFCQQGLIKEDILNMMEQFGLIAKFSISSTDVKYFVPSQLKTPPGNLCKIEPSPTDPCQLYLRFLEGFVPHGLYPQLVSRFTIWCSENGYKQPPNFFEGASRWFFISEKEIVYQLIFICKRKCIKIVLKQRKQDHEGSFADVKEVAILVRTFLEKTMRNLKRDLPWLRNFTYDLCVACPDCPKEEVACSYHGHVSCTHEECLCLLKILDGGQPSQCPNSFCDNIRTFPGLEKWFPIKAVHPGFHPGTKDVYKMTTLPRGTALIINNNWFADHPVHGKQSPRLGTEEDVQQIQALFAALGFDVHTKENLTREELLAELDSLACSNHSEYDCFVLWLMSHGKSGEVFCSDGVAVAIQTAHDMFCKCDTLSGKPKLFFIQACRGDEEDEGRAFTEDISSPVQLTSSHVDSPIDAAKPPVSRVPTHADFLYSFSTVDEHVSYRHMALGSYYVRALVEAFQERSAHDHLLDILTIVNQKVSDMEATMASVANKTDIKIFKQMPEVKHTLRKKVRF